MKIQHRGEYRIKIASMLSPTSKEKIREIIGRKWSQTLISWHLPYTTTAYKELLKKFGKENIKILPSELDKPILSKNNTSIKKNTLIKPQDVNLDKPILKKEKTNIKENLSPKSQKIKSPQWAFYKDKKGKQCRFVTGNFVIVNQLNSLLVSVYVPANHPFWLGIIRKINGRKWNNQEKYWSLPYTQESIDQLQQINAIHFNFELNNSKKQKLDNPPFSNNQLKSTKLKPYDTLNKIQQLAITKFEEMLILERKSNSTIKSYRYHLIDLFRFYPMHKPSQISNKQLKAYMLKKITVNKIKSATQGQILNALVAFYKRLLKQEGHLTDLFRPKKKQSLPNIFSKDEIKKFIL